MDNMKGEFAKNAPREILQGIKGVKHVPRAIAQPNKTSE